MEMNEIPNAQSLAALHDLLTQQSKSSEQSDALSARVLFDQLLPLLQSTTGGRPLQYQADDLRLPAREGASLALLISELISNAVKHGEGAIQVRFRVDAKNARLEVTDDGPGFPAGFDPKMAGSKGVRLIDSAGRYDLRGVVSYENPPEGGARVVVSFPILILPRI